MHTRFRYLAYPGLAAAGALVLSGCGSPSSAPPSSSSSPPSTSTAPSTSKAPQPETKTASSGTTATAPTDNAVAPQRKPPAGLGNAIGRVLFDGKGAPNIEVRLCEEIQLIGGCKGRTYQSKTNKDGFYVIDKIKPGSYALAVRVFDSNQIIYPTAGILSAAKYEVQKDESLAVRTVNLWKTNLQIASPKNGTTVKVDKPKLTWKAYPDATNYKITIRTKGRGDEFTSMTTGEASVTPDKSLLNGDYLWKIEATNAEGTKIAETADDATFKVTGQAGSNTVELVNPHQGASVAADLTLQWKPNPQAQEYKVYLKGVKAKDALLSFVSVNGTSYKGTAPLPPDQYFWSVDAYKDGQKIAGSSLEHFTVK